MTNTRYYVENVNCARYPYLVGNMEGYATREEATEDMRRIRKLHPRSSYRVLLRNHSTGARA